LEPNAIKNVLSSIVEYEPCLIITNSCLKKSKLYKSYKDVLKKVIRVDPLFPIHHTLITTNIFKIELFNFNYSEKYIETNYGHMYAIMNSLTEKNSIYIFGKDKKIISIRKERAKYEGKLVNLEKKLQNYAKFLSKKFESPIVYVLIFVYYNIFNKYPVKIFKGNVIEILKKIRNSYKIYDSNR